MDRGRFLVEAHLREGRPVGEIAAAHRVSRSWSTSWWPATATTAGRASSPAPTLRARIERPFSGPVAPLVPTAGPRCEGRIRKCPAH
jgi:hypothetical protein